jgi:hypothetical protein
MADTIDVNVANQAFPPPPGGSQALPVPSFVQVPNLPMVPPSFSSGAFSAAQANTNVNTQNVTKPSPVDVLVTDSGNFATNIVNADSHSFTISSVATFDAGLTTERFQIFLGVNPGLANFGLTLIGKIASFPAAAPASAPENVPTRPITMFSSDWILVPRIDQFGNSLAAPVATNQIKIIIYRDGTEAINNTNISDVDVTIAPAPPVASTIPSVGGKFLGDIRATDGVVIPFVGSGQGAPPFIGTFEVENQVPIGTGLPANIFQ